MNLGGKQPAGVARGAGEGRRIDLRTGRLEQPEIPVLGPDLLDLRVRLRRSGARPAVELGCFFGRSGDSRPRTDEGDRVVAGLQPTGPTPGQHDEPSGSDRPLSADRAAIGLDQRGAVQLDELGQRELQAREQTTTRGADRLRADQGVCAGDRSKRGTAKAGPAQGLEISDAHVDEDDPATGGQPAREEAARTKLRRRRASKHRHVVQNPPRHMRDAKSSCHCPRLPQDHRSAMRSVADFK